MPRHRNPNRRASGSLRDTHFDGERLVLPPTQRRTRRSRNPGPIAYVLPITAFVAVFGWDGISGLFGGGEPDTLYTSPDNPWSIGYEEKPAVSTIWFANCADAKSRGYFNIRRGQPGYRPEMDGDGDGYACEPYRGR